MADELVSQRPPQAEGVEKAVPRAVADLQRRFEKLALKDLSICDAINRFADLHGDEGQKLMALADAGDDEALKKEGWTRKQLYIALQARKPRAEVPFAMLAAHERTGMRIRRLDRKPSTSRVNVAVIHVNERAPCKADADVVIVDSHEGVKR